MKLDSLDVPRIKNISDRIRKKEKNIALIDSQV